MDEERRRQVKIIANNIKVLLDANGMTNRDLANGLAIGESSIGKWLNGVNGPTMGTLQKVADYFRVSLDDLVTVHETKSFADPNRRYLLDKIDNSSAADLAKLRKMIDLIEGENDQRR